MVNLHHKASSRLYNKLNYNPFYYMYDYVVALDNSIIPNNLKPIVHSPKALMVELFKVENIDFRNNIINFAEKMKVAMNFRANNKMGSGKKVPWKADVKIVNFHGIEGEGHYFEPSYLEFETGKLYKLLLKNKSDSNWNL